MKKKSVSEGDIINQEKAYLDHITKEHEKEELAQDEEYIEEEILRQKAEEYEEQKQKELEEEVEKSFPPQKEEPSIIDEVHKIYKEELYLEDTDFIDTVLAVYVTRNLVTPKDPLWMFPVKPSSYGVTTQLRPFIRLSQDQKYDIELLDQVTSKAFASGTRGVNHEDLGAKFENKFKMILIPDFASISSSDPTESLQLFSMFRTLYDGYISRKTGVGSPNYMNCHVNMFACSTPTVYSSVEFASQMGTRELVYNLPNLKNPDQMLDKSITDKGLKVVDEERLYKVIKDFIDNNGFEFNSPEPYVLDLLKSIAKRITIWRVEPIVDDFGLLTAPIIVEYPTRIYNQLIKLYIGYNAIGLPFDDILKKLIVIENNIGNVLRRQVYNCLFDEKSKPLTKTRMQITNQLNRSDGAVKTQLMVLRELKLVSPVFDHQGNTNALEQNIQWMPITDRI